MPFHQPGPPWHLVELIRERGYEVNSLLTFEQHARTAIETLSKICSRQPR